MHAGGSHVFLTPAATREPARTSAPPDLERSAARVRVALEHEGLTMADLRQLVGARDAEQLRALDYLAGATSAGEMPATGRSVVRDMLIRLEDELGLDLGSRQLAGLGTRVGRRAADVVGALVGLACGWIVIGGLIEGDSLLLGPRAGVAGLALFGLVLSLLGLFEALHTSATMLKIADLSALAERYPRAASLHRHFRTDHGLARFLAGRQMVVVFTVFVCSPLSSFPELTHWPLTGVPLPGPMHPLVAIGMPGALFVLWIGQLVPQFLATRRAVALTNARIVAAAFRLTYLLEGAGLARPGFWLVAWDRSTASIPSSPARRWEQSAQEVDGYGTVGMMRDWLVGPSATELHAASTIRMYRDGIATITDGSLLLPGAPVRLMLDAFGQREGPLPLAASEHREETLPTGDRRFHKPIMSAVGSYRTGDSLRLSLDADYRTDPGRDLVHVERPARFVSFRVAPDTDPSSMRPAVLRSYSVGDGLGDLSELEPPLRIEPTQTPNGVPVLEHVIHFPPANTLYILDWEIELDE
jgi:hypothetical protein